MIIQVLNFWEIQLSGDTALNFLYVIGYLYIKR